MLYDSKTTRRRLIPQKNPTWYVRVSGSSMSEGQESDLATLPLMGAKVGTELSTNSLKRRCWSTWYESLGSR